MRQSGMSESRMSQAKTMRGDLSTRAWFGRVAGVAMAARWLVMASLVISVGCRKADEAPAGVQGPPPMPETEQTRGLEACRAYAERVCRCAESDSTLAEDCSFSSARVEAIENSLALVNRAHGTMAVNDQIATQTSARRIIRGCFEADARLDPATCPRDPPAAVPAAPGDSAARPGSPGPSADSPGAAPSAPAADKGDE